MKYCPNPACPHRARVGLPAEFVDHVTTCSDCTVPLVEEDEIGLPDAPPPRYATLAGFLWLIGGVLVTLIGLAFGNLTGTYLIAPMPILYGIFRLARTRPSGS